MIDKTTLSGKKILVSGQVLNSLTEIVEDYLKDKVKALGVIGISSPYSTSDSARMTYYSNGGLKFTKKIFNVYFHKRTWYSLYMLTVVFLVYFYSIVKSAFRFRIKFDIFVGVSCFSAFVGVVLKWLGVVKKVIYYSIDYFPLQRRGIFEYFMVKSFFALDRFCARYSDLIWHINPDIASARKIFGKVSPEDYRAIHVPLGYGEDLFCFKPFSEIERYTIGFVGTLNPNQGLQMAIRAFAEIFKRFPQAKLEIIGDGIFATEIKRMVKESSAGQRIVLHGFIGDRKKVSQILSHCALGIAPWTMDAGNNIRYADPGKPKHYAFCGLPIIITRSNTIAYEIENMEAGIAINYDDSEFVEAVSKLFRDDNLLQRYRENALKFARKYITVNIFNKTWEQSLDYLMV